jgi:polysaccharide biosynthesis protein PslG
MHSDQSCRCGLQHNHCIHHLQIMRAAALLLAVAVSGAAASSAAVLRQFHNYRGVVRISTCGFPWEKTTKRPIASVYTNCETAVLAGLGLPGQTTPFTDAALENAAVSVDLTLPGSAAGTSALPTIPPSFFGMTIQNFQGVKPALRFGTTRSWDVFAGGWDATPGLDWPHISPKRGSYDFAALQSFISLNQARHAEVIYAFGRTPQWASASPSAPGTYGPGQCAQPANIKDWDDFVRAIATWSGGRIKYWELWNEPNDPHSYCGDMRTMVTLAQHASAIIKGVDPSAMILSPGVVSGSGPSWLDGFLSAGGGAYVDIIAFHGYWSSTAEDIGNVVRSYRNVMKAHHVAAKPLWDTEASWAGRNGGIGGLTDISQRAAFLAKYYILHWSLGVQRLVWYAYDGQSIWGQLWDSSAGLHGDGIAYREIYRWMVGASLRAPCSKDQDSTWICNLDRPNGYKAQVLWNSTSTPTYPVAGDYSDYRDLMGNIHSLTRREVKAGNEPILLETGPIP